MTENKPDFEFTPVMISRAELLRFRCAQLFVLTLPFAMIYSSIAFYLLLATTIFAINRNMIKRLPKQFWFFLVIYFLAFMGYFYSYDKGAAGFLMERQLAILIMPLLLPLSFEINTSSRDSLLLTFTLGLVFTICYLLGCTVLTVNELGLPFTSVFSREFFNHQFSAPIGIHAGYLSLYVSLAIFYLLPHLMHTPTPVRKIMLGAALAILLTGLFFLASRNIIIGSVLILFFIFPFFFIRKKLLFYAVSALFILTAFLAVMNISYLQTRFSSDLLNDMKLNNGTSYNFNGVEPRIERWKCAVELIQASPVVGYGTGDEIPMLKTKYIGKGYYISYLENFNAHNQYLSYAVKNGISGLLIFLAVFVWYLVLAIRNRSYIYLCFLLLLLIGFLTENILDANKGIFFFAFFNTIFGYTLIKERKTKLQEETE